MRPFHSRPKGYKAGIVVLFLATIVYLVGFSAPYWAGMESSVGSPIGSMSMSKHRGLWTVCVGVQIPLATDKTTCTAHSVDGLASTFHAARALSCLCVIVLLVCCFYAILTNCTNSVSSSSYPLLEVSSTLAGLLGFFGCLVFAAYQAGSGAVSSPGLSGVQPGSGFLPSGNGGFFGKGFHSKPPSNGFPPFFHPTTPSGVFPGNGFPSFPGKGGLPTAASGLSLTLGWAFYLAAVGCSLTVIAAVIISLANKPVASQSQDAPAAIPMTTTSYGQGQASWAYPGQGQAPAAHQIQGQGQFTNPGQGYYPAQGQSHAVAGGQGQGQGQVNATSEPPSLGPIQIRGVPPDYQLPSDSEEVLTLKGPVGRDDSKVEDSLS